MKTIYFISILIALLGILFYLFVLWLKTSKKGKGIAGEKTVAYFLNKLEKKEYFVINDITLNVNGNTSQIDHIVVSRYGIFVIETKNWNGIVYGNRWGRYVYQWLRGKRYVSENPVRQNEGHIYRLREVLSDYPNLKYISIVAFGGYAKRKIGDDITIKISEILNTIGKYTEVVINEEDMDSIYTRLNGLKKNKMG